jgi:hypothetical protein
MLNFIRKNLIRIAIGMIASLTIVSATLTHFNNKKMSRAMVLKEQSAFALKEVERTYQNIQLMDISSRGYKIIRKPEYLFWSIDMARNRNTEIFHNLDSIFQLQGFEDKERYPQVKKGLDDYTDMYVQMVGYLQSNQDSLYIALLEKDLGRYFWEVFNPFATNFNAFEAQINQEAESSYKDAVASNNIVQFLLILIGLPTLGFVVYTLVHEEKERRELLLEVGRNNNHYLFNDGQSLGTDARSILGKLIDNLKKAASFVNEISAQNYEAKWDGMEEHKAVDNDQTLAGRLMYMRDQMKKVKEEDARRIWVTEGLSEVSQIIRQHQNNLEDLALKTLTFIIRYTRSQQGNIFVLEENDHEEKYLQLKACYAFDRKKHLDRTVNIGDGLVGQTFLEGQTVLLTSVPPDYLTITSGLGDATPKCVVIVPLKYNERTNAVLELASFTTYSQHEISFLEKAGEFVASAIATVQNNEKNRTMVDQMKSQTEQLRAQEEELRQNLEELEATQEDMRRKESGSGKRS